MPPHPRRGMEPRRQPQLSDVLSSTFLRKLRTLEVMQGSLPPARELLEMWDLRNLTIHVLHRENIKEPGFVSVAAMLDEIKAISAAIASLPPHSQPQNMHFLRVRTRVYIRLKAEFWRRRSSHILALCRGFCICMVRSPGESTAFDTETGRR